MPSSFADPILIYPNIVNMLGEMTVDVNGICLDRTQTYVLMIEQRQVPQSSWILCHTHVLDCYMQSSELRNRSMPHTEDLQLGHKNGVLPTAE